MSKETPDDYCSRIKKLLLENLIRIVRISANGTFLVFFILIQAGIHKVKSCEILGLSDKSELIFECLVVILGTYLIFSSLKHGLKDVCRTCYKTLKGILVERYLKVKEKLKKYE